MRESNVRLHNSRSEWSYLTQMVWSSIRQYLLNVGVANPKELSFLPTDA